ncbi:MAG: hypothetical protein WC799_20870 [Desulfobacteraceae bacterium]|jgi:hypothetical protein
MIKKYWFLWIPTVVKIILASLFWGSTDISNYLGAAEALTANVGIKHNYMAPALNLFYAGNLAFNIGVPANIALKLLPILAELGIGILIYKHFKNINKFTRAEIASLLYLLNPVNIYITVFHGQFDSIAIFLILTTVYLLSKPGTDYLNSLFSALSFSLAIGLKVFPLLLFPILIIHPQIPFKRKPIFVIVSLILICLPALVHPHPSVSAVIDYLKYPLSYRSYGILGLDGALGLLGETFHNFYRDNLRIITIISTLSSVVYCLKTKQSLLESIGLNLLVILAFTTSLAPQYFVWLVPFIFISRSLIGIIFTVFSGFFLPWYYLLPSDNSGVFVSLAKLPFLTPSGLIYYFKFPFISNFLERYIRWYGFSIFFFTWLIAKILTPPSFRYQSLDESPSRWRLSGTFIALTISITIIFHLLAIFLEYRTTHSQQYFDSKLISGTLLAKKTRFLYGFNENLTVSIPKELKLEAITVDGGDYLKVSLNNKDYYYYGNQYWDYHGGWRNTRSKISFPLEPDKDNQLRIISNSTSIRPEFFLNINDSRDLTDISVFPRVTTTSEACSNPLKSDKECYISFPGKSNWHFSIIEILLTANVCYAVYFLKNVSIKDWNIA